MSTAYEPSSLEEYGAAARVVQFAYYALWSGSCAITTCPGAMADGAARLLSRHLDDSDETARRVFRDAYSRLTSRDPEVAWTSGQWMTERSGGSDVRGTETVATFVGNGLGGEDAHGNPLGPWRADGFKWFSSATDSQMAILLAQTEKGLSAFYAPMKRRVRPGSQETELNGVRIQRLKNKLGTKPVPTAELELVGLRAYLVGKEGQGVKEISAILNITRIHNAFSGLGFWGRGLAISKAFARARKVAGGTLLMNMPAHVKTMANNVVDYTAMMHLGFVTVSALGCVEQKEVQFPFKSIDEATALSRLLTPVAKAMCSKKAISGLQECMESLGGIGYMEDEQRYNIARLYRDANVLSIWEGTTEVMATDVVRVVTGRNGNATQMAFDEWVKRHVRGWGPDWKMESKALLDELAILELWWITKSALDLAYHGRDILDKLAWIVGATMMVADATNDGDEVAAEMARRWISSRTAGSGCNMNPTTDRHIVFGSKSTLTKDSPKL